MRWARLKFEEYFVNRIAQLTAIYPHDATTRTGAPFWTPPKRYPETLVFNVDDAQHMQFIIAASNLRAKVGHINIVLLFEWGSISKWLSVHFLVSGASRVH